MSKLLSAVASILFVLGCVVSVLALLDKGDGDLVTYAVWDFAFTAAILQIKQEYFKS